MRANNNFGSVQASQGAEFATLQPGGHAALIHAVIDGTEEASPYVDIVVNVLDPKTKKLMFTNDLKDQEQWWRHTFRYWLTNYDGGGINWARYKALTEAVEQTAQNKGFKYEDKDGGEQQLQGKWVGIVLRRYLYVPKTGKYAGQQRDRLELSRVCTAAQAITGEFPKGSTETRDGRPDNLKGTPYPPAQEAQEPVKAPEGFGQAAPIEVAEDDIPF